MNENLPNLDTRCAQSSYDLVNSITISKDDKKKLENIITKSLGVLQENGLYAFFLYLDYRINELGAKEIKNHSLELLHHIGLIELNEDHFSAVLKLTEKLSHLILSHRLLEQMLIYARYHAKALRVT